MTSNPQDGARDMAVLHHDSTSSSSDTDSPRITTPVLFQTLHVDVHENQRWFPILGWGTSRLPDDPPNFTAVVVNEAALEAHASRIAAPVAAFHRAFPQHNAAPTAHTSSAETGSHCDLDAGAGACRAVWPLELHLPPGYVWDGFWELVLHHPRGTDGEGWRYAPEFHPSRARSGAARVPRAHFKKTQTPICVARYRTWRRRVRLVDGDGPTARRGEPDYVMTDEDTATERYLRDKQEEMALVERLKRRRQEKLAAGEVWTQDDDLAAEEQLRAFTKARRAQSQQRQSAVRGLRGNPFHTSPDDAPVVERGETDGPRMVPLHEPTGATAAASWAADGSRRRQDEAERGHAQNGTPSPEALAESMIELQLKDSFHGGVTAVPPSVDYSGHGAPSQFETQAQTSHGNAPPHRTDGLQTEVTVHDFVAASPRETEEPEEARRSPTGVVADAASDFDAIFQKFVNNPEISKTEATVPTPASDEHIPRPPSRGSAPGAGGGERPALDTAPHP